MSSYFGGVWDRLKFQVGNTTSDMIAGYRYRYKIGSNPTLIYKNNRYDSVLVHVAQQKLVSQTEGELNKLFPQWRDTRQEIEKKFVAQQQAARAELIKNGRKRIEQTWGEIIIEDTQHSSHTIVAQDKYGTPVKEALILSCESSTPITVEENIYRLSSSGAGMATSRPLFTTNTVFHIDLCPQVSMNSAKNIVMTQVQGRDYTRKELVSGGDISFTINGLIVGNEPDVYPVAEVQKLIQIMQYNGIVNINFMMMGVLGVSRIIVKDFSLGTSQCKNEQPYSFSCVAVEPDEELKIARDTINVINEDLKLSPTDKWFNLILENKWTNPIANAAFNTFAGAVTEGTAAGLDALVNKI